MGKLPKFEEADANGDGVIDRQEWSEFSQQHKTFLSIHDIHNIHDRERSHVSGQVELDLENLYSEDATGLPMDPEMAQINDAMFAKHFPDAHRKMVLHK